LEPIHGVDEAESFSLDFRRQICMKNSILGVSEPDYSFSNEAMKIWEEF
jgi:hypothetical protein